MANNQAAVEKLFRETPLPLGGADAAVDAMKWLLHSPELPTPTVHAAEFEGKPYLVLQWLNHDRMMWVRAWFFGDGSFDWMVCGPEHGDLETGRAELLFVHLGAPKALVEYVDFMLREAA